MCMLTDDTYNDDSDFVFSPDAPDEPALTPVKPRATPYTYPPTECTINFQTGTVRCVANDSRGGLYPVPPPSNLYSRAVSPLRRRPMSETVFGDTWGSAPEWAIDPPGTVEMPSRFGGNDNPSPPPSNA